MTKIEAKDSEYFKIQRSPSCEIHGKKKRKEKKTCIYTLYIHWWVMLVKTENTRKKNLAYFF